MKKATTQTISINAEYQKVFNYISNPLTQKEWAINFMKDVKETDNGFIAITPFGEMPLELRANEQTGTIDIILGDGKPIPTRLIKNQNGCEYIFTLFQPTGMPDTAWEREGIPGLTEELKELKSILEQ
ncbi:MAG: hypothetical protein COA58_11640 [Bacteroidetes bacterium]|nr:MAG: hypothetical protein COA58_11640 [Bacteroidota bacterium]